MVIGWLLVASVATVSRQLDLSWNVIDGICTLKGGHYQWLKSRYNMTHRQKNAFSALRHSSLKTARAWAIKEMASRLWCCRSRI